MSNVTYQVERIETDIVYVLETFDLTNTNGPGILVRAGQVVDTKAEGIASATRRIMMRPEQARELGIIPQLTSSSPTAR